MRSSLLDVLGEDYITTVRAKGIRENQVLWRHAVRNALLPTVTLVALSFGFVIGGAVTVEIVFSYPGVGNLTLQALDAQDFQLLQGMFLFFSLAVVLANLGADLIYGRLDPGCVRPDGGGDRTGPYLQAARLGAAASDREAGLGDLPQEQDGHGRPDDPVRRDLRRGLRSVPGGLRRPGSDEG